MLVCVLWFIQNTLWWPAWVERRAGPTGQGLHFCCKGSACLHMGSRTGSISRIMDIPRSHYLVNLHEYLIKRLPLFTELHRVAEVPTYFSCCQRRRGRCRWRAPPAGTAAAKKTSTKNCCFYANLLILRRSKTIKLRKHNGIMHINNSLAGRFKLKQGILPV